MMLLVTITTQNATSMNEKLNTGRGRNCRNWRAVGLERSGTWRGEEFEWGRNCV